MISLICLELQGKEEPSSKYLVYGSIQVFSSGWVLDLVPQRGFGRKCLRDIAYYEWLKKVIFFYGVQSQKNRLLWEQQFLEHTISTDLGLSTKKALAPAL